MKLLYEAWISNDISEWAMASALIAGVALVLISLRMAAASLVRRAPSHITEQLLSSTWIGLLLPLALYAGTSALQLPRKLDSVLGTIVVVALLLQTALWINCLIVAWLSKLIEQRRGVDSEAITLLALLRFMAQIVVWVFALLLILNHLNFNITALVTGLGIGGVAVALAMQNILGDLFASLSIVLDKPFVVGDFIVIDNCMGAVERIGLKTTRLRSLGGELIVFSNADLLKSRIRNYKRMYERRVEFPINVSYDTPLDKVTLIPALLREIVEAQQHVRFDRAHLKTHGDVSLTFEVVYFVLSSDFNLYMDIQQAINVAIFRRFAEEHIEFAAAARALQYKQVLTMLQGGRLALAGERR